MDIEKFKNIIKDLPLGQSCFQNKYLTGNDETPSRRARHLALQINEKLIAFHEYKFKKDRCLVDIEEILAELKNPMNIFQKRRFEIDLEEKRWQLDTAEKGLNDAAIEVEMMWQELESIKVYTREEFEKEEGLYWSKRLMNEAKNQIASTGTVKDDYIKALSQVGIKFARNEHGQPMFLFNDEKTKELGYSHTDITELTVLEKKEGEK